MCAKAHSVVFSILSISSKLLMTLAESGDKPGQRGNEQHLQSLISTRAKSRF